MSSKTFQLFSRLFRPFPDEVKSQKKQGGQSITFVEWSQYVIRAHATFPEGYSKSITQFGQIDGTRKTKGGETEHISTFVCTVRVTDNETGTFQEAMGSADAGKTSWGGAIAEAESQAFRRAMANFGLGLEMYLDDDEFEYADERIAMALQDKKAEEEAEEEGLPWEGEDEVEQDERFEPDDPAPFEEDATGTTDGDGEPTPRQLEVLKEIGLVLSDVQHDKDDPNPVDFLEEQRGLLEGSFTLKTAGAIIRRFRKALEYYGLEDPTKDGEPN